MCARIMSARARDKRERTACMQLPVCPARCVGAGRTLKIRSRACTEKVPMPVCPGGDRCKRGSRRPANIHPKPAGRQGLSRGRRQACGLVCGNSIVAHIDIDVSVVVLGELEGHGGGRQEGSPKWSSEAGGLEPLRPGRGGAQILG